MEGIVRHNCSPGKNLGFPRLTAEFKCLLGNNLWLYSADPLEVHRHNPLLHKSFGI